MRWYRVRPTHSSALHKRKLSARAASYLHSALHARCARLTRSTPVRGRPSQPQLIVTPSRRRLIRSRGSTLLAPRPAPRHTRVARLRFLRARIGMARDAWPTAGRRGLHIRVVTSGGTRARAVPVCGPVGQSQCQRVSDKVKAADKIHRLTSTMALVARLQQPASTVRRCV